MRGGRGGVRSTCGGATELMTRVVCRFECVASGGGVRSTCGGATELMTRVVCRFECVAGGGGVRSTWGGDGANDSCCVQV